MSADSHPALGIVLVRETRRGLFQQEIIAGKHSVLADEPAAVGGLDSGPGPYDLLLAALGACTAMTLRLYADRKKLPLLQAEVRLRHSRIHANDCAECETKDGMLDRIEHAITLHGDLNAEQRARLMEIADKCPGASHPEIGNRHPHVRGIGGIAEGEEGQCRSADGLLFFAR